MHGILMEIPSFTFTLFSEFRKFGAAGGDALAHRAFTGAPFVRIRVDSRKIPNFAALGLAIGFVGALLRCAAAHDRSIEGAATATRTIICLKP